MYPLWGDLTARQRRRVVLFLVREKKLTYSQAARCVTASRSAIAGALARAEGRKYVHKPSAMGTPVVLFPARARPTRSVLHTYSEEHLTERWVDYAARRKAERLAAAKRKA